MELDTGKVRSQAKETGIMWAGREREKPVSEPLGNLGELGGDRKHQACCHSIWGRRLSFLHPIGMLDDNAPSPGPSHVAAPTFNLFFSTFFLMTSLLCVPNTRPDSHTHPQPWSPKGPSSQDSGVWPHIPPIGTSASHHGSLFHSATLCICHCHTFMCINNQHHWRLWKLRIKGIPSSYSSDRIRSIRVYRPELMCLSFTIKILRGEVNRSPMPFPA